MRNTTILLSLATALLSTAGCNAYKIKPGPTGYAKVSSSDWMAHYKASDDTGLNVRVFGNVDGGTLDFWAEDLVSKLQGRGYELVGHRPATTKNKIPGLKLDFAYVPPGTDMDDPEAVQESTRFYTAALFVTDKYRLVLQLAGKQDLAPRHLTRMDTMLGDLKVRGCKVRSKICKPGAPVETTLAVADAKPASPQTKTPPAQ